MGQERATENFFPSHFFPSDFSVRFPAVTYWCYIGVLVFFPFFSFLPLSCVCKISTQQTKTHTNTQHFHLLLGSTTLVTVWHDTAGPFCPSGLVYFIFFLLIRGLLFPLCYALQCVLLQIASLTYMHTLRYIVLYHVRITTRSLALSLSLSLLRARRCCVSLLVALILIILHVL